MRTSDRRDRGFSLAVLLVGVVIVGLVATVVVIGLTRDDKPSTASCEAERSKLTRAEQTFHTDHERYGTEDELVAAGLLDHRLLLQDVTLVADSFQVITHAACVRAAEPGGTAPADMHLVLGAIPDTVTAGRLIEPAIAVTLTDDSGAVLPDSTTEVTISLRSENGGKLLGTTTVSAVAGIATFADLAIDKAGSGYTFAVQSSGATGASSSQVTVNPGSAARLRFVAAPPSATPGAVFATQPIVRVEDVMGNLIENATEPIALAITDHTGDSDGRLACDNLSVVPISGVAMFSGCQIDAPGTDYSLTATTALRLEGQSDRFAVIGSPTKLVVVQQPTTVVAGETLTAIEVAVADSAGNVVTGIDATVTLTVNQNSESMTGTTSAAVVDGVATFADLAITTSATDYTFTMKAPGLKTATSAAFDVTTGPAAQLVFSQQPSGGRAGKSWWRQPIVTAEDAFGNVVAGVDDITLQLTAGTGTSGAVLVCEESPVAEVDGLGTFSKCSVDVAGSYTLTATSGAVSGVSDPFSIT